MHTLWGKKAGRIIYQIRMFSSAQTSPIFLPCWVCGVWLGSAVSAAWRTDIPLRTFSTASVLLAQHMSAVQFWDSNTHANEKWRILRSALRSGNLLQQIVIKINEIGYTEWNLEGTAEDKGNRRSYVHIKLVSPAATVTQTATLGSAVSVTSYTALQTLIYISFVCIVHTR